MKKVIAPYSPTWKTEFETLKHVLDNKNTLYILGIVLFQLLTLKTKKHQLCLGLINQ